MLSREWGGLNGVVWLTTYIISFWSSATDPKRLSCNRCQATSWKHEDCVRQDSILLHANPPLPIKFKVTYLAVQHSAKNYHASPNRPTGETVHLISCIRKQVYMAIMYISPFMKERKREREREREGERERERETETETVESVHVQMCAPAHMCMFMTLPHMKTQEIVTTSTTDVCPVKMVWASITRVSLWGLLMSHRQMVWKHQQHALLLHPSNFRHTTVTVSV